MSANSILSDNFGPISPNVSGLPSGKWTQKFFVGGTAVTTEAGTKIYMAPFANANQLGVVDTGAGTCSLVDVWDNENNCLVGNNGGNSKKCLLKSRDVEGASATGSKYAGAASVGGKVYLAPYACKNILVYDTEVALDATGSAYTTLGAEAYTRSESFMGAVAVDSRYIVLAPFGAPDIVIVDTETDALTSVEIVPASAWREGPHTRAPDTTRTPTFSHPLPRLHLMGEFGGPLTY